MKIYTSYFGQLINLKEKDIMPIGIVRYVPKWFRGTNFIKVAPYSNMLRMKKRQYGPLYLQILNNLNPIEIFNELVVLSGESDFALCCYEKDRNDCHRKIFADWLNINLDLEIKEFIY